MPKLNFKKAQAASELAVFGAILIFVLGTIVRTAVGNGYAQNQNFKAMRMAMLESWTGSKTLNFNTATNPSAPSPDTSRNSASVLFVEDRLSPDFNKYGDLDRTPFVAQGSGTFSYSLLYPLSQESDIVAGLPVMDTYINGVYFPFSMATYVSDKPLSPPSLSYCQSLAPGSCQANQCYRSLREWAGGIIRLSSFVSPNVAPINTITTTSAQRVVQENNNACTIFTDLAQANIFDGSKIQGSLCSTTENGFASTSVPIPLTSSAQWASFMGFYKQSFPNLSVGQYNTYFQAIAKILQIQPYKLFYTRVVPLTPQQLQQLNSSGSGSPTFTLDPPTCKAHPCMYQELSSDVPLLDYYGNVPAGNPTNAGGVMQYDLLRNAFYYSGYPNPVISPASTTTPVSQIFPSSTPTLPTMRNYVAWQWAATAATTTQMIGLDASNNQYPTYDIDGRLKEVTIYNIWQDSGNTTHIAYEDSQGGDIDGTWDADSCGLKPGLQNDSQVFTFTQAGTYLLIKEGKIYNPETDQFVRSANQRDTIDLIQRQIQLSNNTGRFCTPCANGSFCGSGGTNLCSDGKTSCNVSTAVNFYRCTGTDCANPNMVETCAVESQSVGAPCTSTANMPTTCYDVSRNVIFVRSRLQDRRGRFWLTDTSGQLKVK